MTGETVLIAAFSARALAQSARRAGFEPLVVDCFGDVDTVAAAAASRCLPARVQIGFTTKPLMAALESLAEGAARPPIGLVLGSGFECNPRLVAKLGERFRLIGNDAETIRRTKHPETFFAVLDKLGIHHPETRLSAPELVDGWLMKRIGGSGGLHIHTCPETPRPDARRYFQRCIGGEAISLLGILAPKSSAFAFSRQWSSPAGRRPFRYGGAAGSLAVEEELEARLIGQCLELSEELGLVGLVSFDFLVAECEASLLEINPRPGASIDVFDDAAGTLFRTHVEACLGGDAASFLEANWHPPIAKAAAFLYADRGTLTVPAVDWPAWTADRAQAGTVVSRGQPLATVLAEGDQLDNVEHTCRERLGLLDKLLYESEKL